MNTLEDHILSDVKLKVASVDSQGYGLKLLTIIHLTEGDQIKFNERRYVYAILTKEDCQHPFPQAKLHQKLQIKITEIDIDSQEGLGSYEEDYSLDEVQIAVKDYITPYALGTG